MNPLTSSGVLLRSLVGKVTSDPIEGSGSSEKLGYSLLRLACKRLPEELRELYYTLWAAELDEYFQSNRRLLNRIFWAIWFPVVMFSAGLRTARILSPKSFPAVWVQTSNREKIAMVAVANEIRRSHHARPSRRTG